MSENLVVGQVVGFYSKQHVLEGHNASLYLELMLFCHDNHVEVGIRHEGEIRAVSLLRTPPSALARVPQHHVKVSPDTKSNIAM